MTLPIRTFIFACCLALSAAATMPAQAQSRKPRMLTELPDSTRMLNGLSVSVDAVGLLQLALSDYGQYEAALRVNLKDRWFPILELGYGRATHDDEVTRLSYRSKAPYGRLGIDFNLMKDKHDIYRIYGGARYAFTSFKYDVWHPGLIDPTWGGEAEYRAMDVEAWQHWAEAAIGVEAKIAGPIHLGWSVRYRMRLAKKWGDVGEPWYVPGFGRSDTSNLGGTFNVIFNI